MSRERHARVSELFLAAVELPAGARGAYLQEICGDDAALRREVEELLARDAGPAAVDALSVASNFRRALEETETALATPPARLGDYEILGPLGAGGMGTVYRARQARPARVVALKVLNAAVLSPELLKRFELEALLLARLQHPGIAQIYEAGVAQEHGRPVPFFALELIEGPPLANYVEERGLDARDRLRLLIKICDAVHHAHQKGVIHRDLKPANILVDARGQPKVLDFGVARATDADLRAAAPHTTAGLLIGTLPYMSPEQVSGDPDQVDTRSDIYALGVMGYELLASRPPYELRGGSLADAVRVIRETEPPPLGDVNRYCRGDVETIMAKALEKDKERRYASVSDFAADLERHLRDEPIQARPPTLTYQLGKFARRNKSLVGAAALTLAALLAGVAGTGYGLWRATQARDAAVREAAKAGTVNNFLNRLFESVNPLGDVGYARRDVTMLEVLDREAAKIGQGFAWQPDVEAEVRLTVGRAYKGLGRYAQAETHLRRVLELGRARGAADPRTTQALRELASALLLQGRRAEGLDLLRQALELTQTQRGAEHLETALTESRLGWALANTDAPAEAETHLRRALELFQRCGADGDQVAAARNNLARALRARGKLDEAEALYRQANETYRQQFGEKHVTVGLTENNLARILYDRGRLDEAEAGYRRALEICEQTIGDAHPLTGDVLNNLAQVLYDRGRYAEAAEHQRRVLGLYREAVGEEHADFIMALNNLAFTLAKLEAWEEAEAAFARVAAFRRARHGETHWRALESELAWADCAGRLGRFAETEARLLRAYELFQKDGEVSASAKRWATGMAARFYRDWGQADEAAKYERLLKE